MERSDTLEVISIDGPAGAGKSTVAQALAVHLGWRYLDSGAMYRAVALTALERGVDLQDSAALGRLAESLSIEFLGPHSGDGRDQAPHLLVDGVDVAGRLREPQVTASVGDVADSPEVRQVLRAVQRQMGAQGRVIMDGRDIGTYVFPTARHKFYLDADLTTRAERRLENIRQAGHQADLAQVIAEIRQRDDDDRSRAIAPLRPALDAVMMDTTGLNVDQVVQRMLEEINPLGTA